VITGGVVQPVPGTPEYVVGMMEFERGTVPVLRLDSWLEIPERPYEVGGQVLLVQSGDYQLGIAVDRVREVQLIDDEELKPPSEALVSSPMVQACWQSGARWILMLDAEKLVDETLALREQLPQWRPVAADEVIERVQTEGTEQYCVFSRGTRELALPISAAREMLSMEEITTVPQAPSQLLGVLNLRGSILPVLRIDGWLGLPVQAQKTPLSGQIVVVETGEVSVGIVIDRVHEVKRVDLKDVKPYVATSEGDMVFQGTWDTPGGRVAILDADRLVGAAVEAVSGGFRQVLAEQRAAAVRGTEASAEDRQ
jgi:purine-binding chemotaxis protein CheW